MRVLLIALSLPLVVAASEPARKPASQPQTSRIICAPKGPTPAAGAVADGTDKQRARPLSEMPPAKQVLTVIRTVDGCDVPTVVRENIGGQ